MKSYLKWSKRKEHIFRRNITDKKNIKYGVACFFVPVTERSGLKMYGNAGDRNYAYRLQTRAAKHDLAPEVGEKFKLKIFGVSYVSCGAIKDLWVNTVYGYVTEKVRVPKIVGYRREEELADALEAVGLEAGDLRPDNMGIKKGRLVCIDFDECSMGSSFIR